MKGGCVSIPPPEELHYQAIRLVSSALFFMSGGGGVPTAEPLLSERVKYFSLHTKVEI